MLPLGGAATASLVVTTGAAAIDVAAAATAAIAIGLRGRGGGVGAGGRRRSNVLMLLGVVLAVPGALGGAVAPRGRQRRGRRGGRHRQHNKMKQQQRNATQGQKHTGEHQGIQQHCKAKAMDE